jgi:hypothetical protein
MFVVSSKPPNPALVHPLQAKTTRRSTSMALASAPQSGRKSSRGQTGEPAKYSALDNG